MITNSKQYVNEQYNDSTRLDIRIRLHEVYSTNPTDWHEWVFDQLTFAKGSNVIEFGCGTGAMWAKNRSKIQEDWTITLTDQSEGMLTEAKRNIGELPNVTYQGMDIQAIASDDASFDVAVANHMLYHVPDRNRALAETRRILKPTGVLYASTNGLSHIGEIYDFVEEFDRTLPLTKPMNAIYFGLENGEKLLRNHFRDVLLIRYESDLRVTQVQDLADYMFTIGTGLRRALEDKGQYDVFLAFLESKKNEQGYIPVSKDSGLFVCRV